LTRSLNEGTPGFEAPVPVTSEPWSFDGCPHDGPSLALGRDRLHVLWMDAHSGKGRIYAAHSPLSSWSFATRALSPDATRAQGHPKLIAQGSTLLAVWDEALDEDEPAVAEKTPSGGHEHGHDVKRSGSGRAIMFSVSTDDGASFTPARPVSPRLGAFQLNPALAVASDGAVLIAWNELDESGKRVVVARVPQDRGGR
jgi:hypothetical protein